MHLKVKDDTEIHLKVKDDTEIRVVMPRIKLQRLE
jgi:hypothetical protein